MWSLVLTLAVKNALSDDLFSFPICPGKSYSDAANEEDPFL